MQNPETTGVESYRDLFRLVYDCPYDENTTYGELLARQDYRYAGHWGYERKLLGYDVGADADPVVHNIRTFNFVANTIRIEEAMGEVRLSPYQKMVALTAALIHDAVEGVVGDVPHGKKTPEFRRHEAD